MEELGLLKPILMRREKGGHKIPIALRYWLFFKRHILEKDQVREIFKQERLEDLASYKRLLMRHANVKAFAPRVSRRRGTQRSTDQAVHDVAVATYHYYKSLLHPDSPVEARRSEMLPQGLFAKKDLRGYKEHPINLKELSGFIIVLDPQEFRELAAGRYPSLFGQHSVMIGPLALANHICHGKFQFSPAATQSEPEEFLGIKQVRLFCVKGCTLSTGTEVAVDYHPDTKDRMEIFGGECKCPSCVQSR